MAWSILDCTLRDGGYYTNWDFDQSLVQNYMQAMADLPIQYIEIGYRNPAQPNYAGEYYYLPRSTMERIYSEQTVKPQLSIMLDSKSCTRQIIPNLLKDCEGLVKLVRMTVSPYQVEHGIEIAKAVKDCGFDVAVNLMYLSRLKGDYKILSEFEALGDVVDYLYLVDSYGACFPEQIKDAIQLAKNSLPQKIGFHGHDNLSLAFANTLAALEAGVDIVDSTVLGMGRGAGNLRTELIIAYLCQSMGKPLDLSPIADLLEPFQKMKDSYRWGADLPYVVSGLADLPQKEVMEWLGKKRYSTSSIVQALQGEQQSVLNNESYPTLGNCLEQLSLQNIKTCIVVGGGSTAKQHCSAIIEYAKHQNGLLIHSSLKNSTAYAKAGAPQVLCLPGREAEKLKRVSWPYVSKQFTACVLAASPRMANGTTGDLASITFEVDPIIEVHEGGNPALLDRDSPLGLALGVANTLGVERVFLTGFDGYPGGTEVQQELAKEVQEILNLFTVSYPSIQIQSLTPTRYSVSQSSVYALIESVEKEEAGL